MKKYIKPDAEIVKFDIVDVTTAASSDPFDFNSVYVEGEGVYAEGDGYMTPVVE